MGNGGSPNLRNILERLEYSPKSYHLCYLTIHDRVTVVLAMQATWLPSPASDYRTATGCPIKKSSEPTV